MAARLCAVGTFASWLVASIAVGAPPSYGPWFWPAAAETEESVWSPLSDDRVETAVYAAADDEFYLMDATGWTDGVPCRPTWTGRAGAVILDRSRPDDNVIARPAGGLLSVSAGGDFNFDWQGGVDVYLARQPAGANGVEFRYFGVDSAAGFDYGDTGDLDIADDSVTGLSDVDALYRSRLHSAEVNLRMPSSARVTWLAGFRWIELDEQLNYDIDLLLPINNDFRWNSDNRMYGGQLGADLNLWNLNSPLAINSIFKAGVYGNNASNQFSYHVANLPVLGESAGASDVSFVGEIDVAVSYELTRRLALRGGYQLLWVNGAALASDQAALTLDNLDTDVVTLSGDVFYHGALVGAEYTW